MSSRDYEETNKRHQYERDNSKQIQFQFLFKQQNKRNFKRDTKYLSM